MEKQYTKEIKDYLVKIVAAENSFPESLVDSVVMWAYKDVRDAMLYNNSVELSGYGSLIVSPTKLKKRATKFQNIDAHIDRNLAECTEGMKAYWNKKKASCKGVLDIINRKLKEHGIESDSGGISQPPVSSEGYEGGNREGVEGTLK